MAIIAVDFVGGPAEGRQEHFDADALPPRYEVFVHPPQWAPCWEAAQPGDRYPLRRAEYILHRYNGRPEYVHAGTREY